MSLESKFQADLIKDIEALIPGCITLKGNSSARQGIPDLAIFLDDKYAFLECKRDERSPAQPNQPYYVAKLNEWSFAAFVFPQNRDDVLNQLVTHFGM